MQTIASIPDPRLGVVLVAYDSSDVILDCLESLLASTGVSLSIVVVDNGSTDGTPNLLRRWADGVVLAPLADLPIPVPVAPKPLKLEMDPHCPAIGGHCITLIEAGINGGFARGVNRGLAVLAACAGIDRFWVLNPDTVVLSDTAKAFATAATPPGGFSFMSGRLLYLARPDTIQIDGGTINWRTGITGNLNLFASRATTPMPRPDAMAFVTGASMVVSRYFYENIGPMQEDYFLYYEEVDWAMRRGNLPFLVAPDAIVLHRAGSAIGSAGIGRPASPFSLYFKHRARILFLRRWRPSSVPMGLAWSVAKAGQLAANGFHYEARALLAGAFGRPPPSDVRTRLSGPTLEKLGLKL